MESPKKSAVTCTPSQTLSKPVGVLTKNPSPKHYRHRFDFEIGYLVKSPCRTCSQRPEFPGCSETCGMLNEIHTLLCESVSCTKRG